MAFDDGDYEQNDDVEPEPPRRRKRARSRTNPFIDAETGVDGDASGEENADDKINDLDEYIVTKDV